MSISIGNIYDAITSLERAADSIAWNSPSRDARDRARDMQATARLAMQEYNQLSSIMGDVRAYMASKAAAYDAYVTRDREPDAEGCSCHINPPCGYCMRQSDEEAAA